MRDPTDGLEMKRGTRGAYFLLWSQGDAPSPIDSVKKKIGQQVRIWTELGIEPKLFIIARQDCQRSWADLVGAEHLHIVRYESRLSWLAAYERTRRAVLRYQPAFLYTRQELYMPSLEALYRQVPTFMELNGDEEAEMRSAPRVYGLYRRLTYLRMTACVAGFVGVANELTKLPAIARFQRPTTVIGNGIDLSKFQVLDPPKSDGLRFGFIGSYFGALWQGVPKIVELARRRPDWQFELIGMTNEQLGAKLPNLNAHGILTRPQYEPILGSCDVALGVLSAYEKDCFEASALKVRECLAYGLPIVTAVDDTDFMDGAPFILELPNAKNNVEDNVDRIEAFAKSWKGRRVPRELVQHLDATDKERRRLAFIESVVTHPKMQSA